MMASRHFLGHLTISGASAVSWLIAGLTGPTAAPARANGAWGVAYAPADVSAPRPAIVYFHGMWASPEDSCGHFARASAPFGFLVCPRGNAPLGDGRMWAGTYASVAPALRAALGAAGAMAPGKLDRSGDGTLVGYSNGAYFAVVVAESEPGRWTGLVLLSMHLDLDAARLRATGVRRVVLAAGERDAAQASMRALARRTDAAGLPAVFMTLGAGGHELPGDIDERMSAAVAWVRGTGPDARPAPEGP
jgi:predicted esterase